MLVNKWWLETQRSWVCMWVYSMYALTQTVWIASESGLWWFQIASKRTMAFLDRRSIYPKIRVTTMLGFPGKQINPGLFQISWCRMFGTTSDSSGFTFWCMGWMIGTHSFGARRWEQLFQSSVASIGVVRPLGSYARGSLGCTLQWKWWSNYLYSLLMFVVHILTHIHLFVLTRIYASNHWHQQAFAFSFKCAQTRTHTHMTW